mmetsp:Transcript_4586/g.8522  ORF Transcript_4586/g.8522 Transcript_4586/m.8522 type:complete len:467 (-) Transcript_4586:20-1420(-)
MGSRLGVNGRRGEGCPLTVACHAGDKYLYFVKRLLEKDKSLINKEGKNFLPPLALSCGGGHVEVTKYLLGVEGVDVNRKATNRAHLGKTPLTMAIVNAEYECLSLLMEMGGADLDLGSSYMHGDLDENRGMLELMVGLPNHPQDWSETPLFLALRYLIKDRELLASKRMRERMGDDGDGDEDGIGGDNLQILELNLRTINREMIFTKLLDAGGGRIGDKYVNALSYGFGLFSDASGYEGIYRKKQFATPLVYAAYCGDAELVDLILKNTDCDVNRVIEHASEGYLNVTALHMSAISGNCAAASSLLKTSSINVNALASVSYPQNVGLQRKLISMRDATPLFLACYLGHVSFVRLLLNNLPTLNLNAPAFLTVSSLSSPSSSYFGPRIIFKIFPRNGKHTPLDASLYSDDAVMISLLKSKNAKGTKIKDKQVKKRKENIEEEKETLHAKRMKVEKKIREIKNNRDET